MLAALLPIFPFGTLHGFAASSKKFPASDVDTLTAVVADTMTAQPTATDTDTPTVTSTATETALPTRTFTATAVLPTVTAAPTATNTVVPTVTGTAGPAATATPSNPQQERPPPAHYVVMFVVDAGRPSYYTLPNLPHIRALMRNGTVYDRAWVGEMQSSTPNVHVTLGTGELPRQTGFMGFGWADPVTRKIVDYRTLLANGAIDPILRALPQPSIAARLHQLMPGAVSIAASGHKDYAAVGLGGGSSDYLLYGLFTNTQFVPKFMHNPPPLTPAERASLTIKRSTMKPGDEDSWAIKYASIMARHVRPKLLMINLPEMDTWGHWNGPNAQAVMGSLVRNVDRGIGQIEDTYKKLGIYNKTDFILTADHGMMESIPARNWRVVQDAAAGGHQHVVRADGEGGAIWFDDPTIAKAAAERVVAMHPQHVMAVFYRSQPGTNYGYVRASPNSWLVSPAAGKALETLVNTTAGINGPDIWVLYRENYTVVPRNVAGTWKGTHGGPTWKVQHIPLILSGPGVRKGFHSQFPARAIDVAPTIERLLGLPAIHRDGVILGDALVGAAKWETGPQKAIAPALGTNVSAMIRQSDVDGQIQHEWPQLPPPASRCKAAKGGRYLCTSGYGSPTDG